MRWMIGAGMLGACAPTMSDEPAPPPAEAEVFANDVANIHVDLGEGSEAPVIRAVAADRSRGWVNFAECLLDEAVSCLHTLPEVGGELLLPQLGLQARADTTQTRFLGDAITVAGYAVPFVDDVDQGIGYYAAALGEADAVPQGPIDVSWGGDWPTRNETAVLDVSAPLELLAPLEPVVFNDADSFEIQWVPSGADAVTLTIATGDVEAVLTLDDNGRYVPDWEALWLVRGGDEPYTFTLRRWDLATVERDTHTVDVLATSEATFTGTMFVVGNRVELVGADTCDEAALAEPTPAGGYWGRLGDYAGDVDPPADCLGDALCAGGFDAFYPVDVPPNHLLSAWLEVFDDDAAVYVLRDCADTGTCLTASHVGPLPPRQQLVEYLNPTSSTERLYVVVDSVGGTCDASGAPVDSAFTLDLGVYEFPVPPMFDTCADAVLADPIASGTYYDPSPAYGDTLDPGEAGCTGTALPGPDAITPIEVAPGSTVVLNLRVPGGNGALYLVSDCGDAATCEVGCDNSGGEREVCAYTNPYGVTERLYLVVDGASTLAPYFLSVVGAP